MNYKNRFTGEVQFFTYQVQPSLIEMLLSKVYCKGDILAVGCGDGNEIKTLHKYGNVDLLDISREGINLIPKSLYHKAYVEDICNFKTCKRYDIVVAFDVLEHIQYDYKALENIHNCLKEGGYFVFTVPAHQWLFSSHDIALEHYRRYGRQNLLDKLKLFFNVEYLSYRYFFIAVPVIVHALLTRNREPKEITGGVPKALNNFLIKILRFEIKLMGAGLSLPYGTSIVGVCRK